MRTHHRPDARRSTRVGFACLSFAAVTLTLARGGTALPAATPLADRAKDGVARGIALAGAGRLEAAVAAERAVLARVEREPAPNPNDLAAIRFALGTALFRSGSYDESASMLQSVAKIQSGAAATILALAVASGPLGAAGRTPEADASLDAALALDAVRPDGTRGALVSLWRARLRMRDGRYVDAERELAEASRVAAASPQTIAVRGDAESLLGTVYFDENRAADSRAAFDRARLEFAKLPASLGRVPLAVTDESQAELEIRAGRYDAARRAIARVSRRPNGDSIAAELEVLDGVAAVGERRYADAVAAFDRARTTMLAISKTTALGATALLDRSIAERLAGRYRAARFDLYAAHAALGTVVDASLSAQFDAARAVLDFYARDDRDAAPAFAAAFDDLERDRSALSARNDTLTDAYLTYALQRPRVAELGTAAFDVALFRDAIVASAPSSRALVTSDVRAALHPNDAAVEIVRFHRIANRDATGPAWYAAVVLRADRPAPFVVELGPADAIEGPALTALRESGIAPNERRIPSDASAFSNLVWAPIANAIVGVHTVYLAGDGVVATIAFDALRNVDGSFVADRAGGPVVPLDSMADLIAVPTPPPAPQSANAALLFGDPQFGLGVAERRLAVARMRGGAATPGTTSLVDASHVLDARLASLRPATDATPLPRLAGSGDAVRDVARRLRAHRYDARTFTGADALQETFEAHVHGQRVIELATHGLFLPDADVRIAPAVLPQTQQPLVGAGSLAREALPPLPDALADAPADDRALRAVLFFAGADGAWSARETPPPDLESGVLTAAEASALDLHGTELVVLRACETGPDSVRSDDGVVALRRALRAAGARDVLMSLWRLPDRETTEVMDAFYAHWLDGMEAHDALRKAQGDERAIVAKRYGTADPYYWAGLTIVGPPSRT